MIASKEVLDLIHSIGTVCFPGGSGYFLYASSWHHVNLKLVVFPLPERGTDFQWLCKQR